MMIRISIKQIASFSMAWIFALTSTALVLSVVSV